MMPFTKACHRQISRLSSFARITSALMSFRSCVDGGAVLGKTWKQAIPSKQQWSVGACVDGIGYTRTRADPQSLLLTFAVSVVALSTFLELVPQKATTHPRPIPLIQAGDPGKYQ